VPQNPHFFNLPPFFAVLPQEVVQVKNCALHGSGVVLIEYSFGNP
jgi:hypothetical protein